MVDKKETQKLKSREPVFLVRPAFKNFGLDYLHITLLALVVILVILAFALSTFKPAIIIKGCGSSTNSTCNSTAASPYNTIHTSAEALGSAERYLAAYSTFNTSLSLLPYYSLVNQSSENYLSNKKEWLVTIPYIDPLANGTIFNISILLYDSNLSIAGTYLQSIKPNMLTNNSVVGLGTVSLYGEAACKSSKPLPVYVITDPYCAWNA